MPKKALATVLKRLRKKAGLSQEALAERADLHRTYISQLERGQKSPTLETLYRLTDSFGIDMITLIEMVEDELT